MVYIFSRRESVRSCPLPRSFLELDRKVLLLSVSWLLVILYPPLRPLRRSKAELHAPGYHERTRSVFFLRISRRRAATRQKQVQQALRPPARLSLAKTGAAPWLRVSRFASLRLGFGLSSLQIGAHAADSSAQRQTNTQKSHTHRPQSHSAAEPLCLAL